MGSSGSSHQHQQQWTHTFPRELQLARHHSQPPGHKVLPEPPNQRLRATNNGNIIHNGGTISARRPEASSTLPHDFNKHGAAGFRDKHIVSSNLGLQSRRTSSDQCPQYLHLRHRHHQNQSRISSCGQCQTAGEDTRNRDNEISADLKRFGSEPDLRYSFGHQYEEDRSESRRSGSRQYAADRDTQERQQSRYRSKKKYKAPPPPPPATNGIEEVHGSSPDSFKWERNRDERDSRGACRTADPLALHPPPPPPPRRSRLFKTRAESKKSQANWNCSSGSTTSLHHLRGGQDFCSENETSRRRLRQEVVVCVGDGDCSSWQRATEHEDDDGNIAALAAWSDCRESISSSSSRRRRRFQIWEGKNTLQRSMSSPEFQAELIQAAKKVRTNLEYCKRGAPVGDSTIGCSKDRKILLSKNQQRRRRRNSQDFSKISRSRQKEEEEEEEEGAEDEKEESIRTYEMNSRIIEDATRRRMRRRTSQSSPGEIDYSSSKLSNGEKSLEKVEDQKTRVMVLLRKPLCDSERSKIRLDCGWEEDEKKGMQVDSKTRNELNKTQQERLRSRSSESTFLETTRREKMEVRGQGSGKESTPESSKTRRRRIGKENSDPKSRRRKENSRESTDEKGWNEPLAKMEKKELNNKVVGVKGGLKAVVAATVESRYWEKCRNIVPASDFSKPKTFYFGMADSHSLIAKESRDSMLYRENNQQIQSSRLLETDNKSLMIDHDELAKKSQSEIDDIALKLRPTLPKKQPEIPRFSPSAAWRLLSALETAGPTMSTVSEEIPVMFEERIERLSRPPPLMMALQDPRSSLDKSGDSGISGDAGAVNDDSLDVGGSPNRIKPPPPQRPTWTPQQDLGEESSSDAGLDSSPPPLHISPVKFPSTRPHVFSLSLPREENRLLYDHNSASVEPKTKQDMFSFNSLQKLKRSVSGALGFSPSMLELEKKRLPGDLNSALDDNWLLSTSPPTSLQHNQINKNSKCRAWESGFSNVAGDKAEDKEKQEKDQIDAEDRKSDLTTFIMRPALPPPSFSYLASGGHVMYLPDSRAAGDEDSNIKLEFQYKQQQQAATTTITSISTRYKKNESEEKVNYSLDNNPSRRSFNYSKFRKLNDAGDKKSLVSSRGFSKSCENISYEAKQREKESPERRPANLQDKMEEKRENTNKNSNNNNNHGKTTSSSSRPKRFTFQSTVRQIERRRLAEKLSREAEAKERQRKNELEAMRKVEEEFQRKRAREKANIRHQLRLYSMDENMSLPTTWDSTQLSRAEPDGAPSSSASSPTSAPAAGNFDSGHPRKNSASSDEYHRKLGTTFDFRRNNHQHQNREHREYKDYRSKYYDWTTTSADAASSSHTEYKQTTVHPKVVYDIPKSSPIFVDANSTHVNKPAVNLNSTPRSDNYRKDFAHGAVTAARSSSESEISQPNIYSRHSGSKSKPLRSRF